MRAKTFFKIASSRTACTALAGGLTTIWRPAGSLRKNLRGANSDDMANKERRSREMPLSLQWDAVQMLGPGSALVLSMHHRMRHEQQRQDPFQDRRLGSATTNTPCLATKGVLPMHLQRPVRVKKVLCLSVALQ